MNEKNHGIHKSYTPEGYLESKKVYINGKAIDVKNYSITGKVILHQKKISTHIK
jgi:antitoxin component YwqK of YwqJK toxin-antitoxin module